MREFDHPMTTLVLRNCRIDGGEPIDLLIENGKIVQIGVGLTAPRSIVGILL